MTNQHAGASVLKGGLLQCYQLQARVYGARTGTGTGPCAGRLGTPLGSPRLSPSFVTGVFVWLPPQGGWRHTWGSRPLPGAHISIRRSLGSVATSRSPPPGGVLCQRGWAALMASEGCFQGWRPPASPTPRSGLVQVGCYTPYVWLLPWREQYPLFPGQNSVLQDQGHRTLIFKCSLTLLRGPSTHGSDSFPSQDQDTCFPHVG